MEYRFSVCWDSCICKGSVASGPTSFSTPEITYCKVSSWNVPFQNSCFFGISNDAQGTHACIHIHCQRCEIPGSYSTDVLIGILHAWIKFSSKMRNAMFRMVVTIFVLQLGWMVHWKCSIAYILLLIGYKKATFLYRRCDILHSFFFTNPKPRCYSSYLLLLSCLPCALLLHLERLTTLPRLIEQIKENVRTIASWKISKHATTVYETFARSSQISTIILASFSIRQNVIRRTRHVKRSA